MEMPDDKMTGESSAMAHHPSEAEAPCPHCDSLADASLCQADDWADAKQTLQPIGDGKPLVADRLSLLVAMVQFKPARLGLQLIDTESRDSTGITPTSRHDISRC